ncbi:MULTISPECIES: flagellar hook-basal body complex protein FliE [Pseudoxanthomonas]|uniref:Flagellar hook-basal body complex protein FliE n=1 Tax=Pseudoxanthomonas winnipegensis TaxID=2480810 RepID=A0AAW8GFZ3_9GAMM|nr:MULTISPECIES: flagellar hook-basal body complex protein FliE [Pseudoxanthomonas]MDQ1120671.1 flagellar hook-basal body complex protein FliE [Pseudoxanthomonas winnipegensis]MDQ1133894.1 flagellar hook-basal body complex protein FliE [Pseudoxanthomonas winnipegensis]MDR6139870.1 flagellar hook-basal body complex protein FliE [Pseudoxanthomonas sp. SORGH_AS_0997]
MNAIDPIMAGQSSAAGAIELSNAVSTNRSAAGGNFGELALGIVSETNAALLSAKQNLLDVAAGKEISPHALMISMEEARINLTMLAEVRSRMVEAYQELMRTQL